MSLRFFLLSLSLLLFLSTCKNDYHLTSYEYTDTSKSHLKGTLEYNGTFNANDYHYNWTNSSSHLLIPIRKLTIEIGLECDTNLHIRITDADKQRWEVPYSISDNYKTKIQSCLNTTSLADIGFNFTESPFTFSLTHSKTGEVYYTTENVDFLYTDTFIGFGGYMTSNDIFGFGERYHKLKLGDGKFTMWPNDTCGLHQDYGDGGYNAHGTHPMALHRTQKGHFLGVIFNNINSQDVYINTESEGKVLVEHLTSGGVIDYYFYAGKDVEDTLIQLHDIIGQPMLPPYWSLGFHQCRWGYLNTLEIETVYRKYYDLEIPFDTIWGDVDILADKRIFSLNTVDFKDLPLLIYEMHQTGTHFVPIVDLGFPNNTTDPYYAKGLETNAFILSNYTGEHLLSFVWPGEAVFPDYFTEQGRDLWYYAMEEYYDIIKYDGIWIDMNEPAMISPMENNRGEVIPDEKLNDTLNYYEYIPYIPGYRPPTIINVSSRSLSDNALSVASKENPLLTGYNFKPLLALLQGKYTNDYLVKLNKRPFILSRSTMLGMGKWSFHWLGDNESKYEDLVNGINGIYQFQIYGIPFTGDDICGFNGHSNDMLCARWITLGAFFPFARNHNAIGNPGQELYVYGTHSYTFTMGQRALRIRYSLLRYYYTQLFLISKGIQGSFFKPVFFELPNDSVAYNYVDSGIMIGSALYLIPATSAETTYKVYYPNMDLIEWESKNITKTYDSSAVSGSEEEIEITMHDIKLYFRGGYIIPKQETYYPFVRNTKMLHTRPTELYIQPDSANHIAMGDVIFDDDAVDTLQTGNYLHVNMNFNTDVLLFSKEHSFTSSYQHDDINISYIQLFRMEYLKLGNNAIATITGTNGSIWNAKIAKVSESQYTIDLRQMKLSFETIASVKLSPSVSKGFLSILE